MSEEAPADRHAWDQSGDDAVISHLEAQLKTPQMLPVEYERALVQRQVGNSIRLWVQLS